MAVGGAAAGAVASTAVPDQVLLAAFAVLLLAVAGVMVTRAVRVRRGHRSDQSVALRTDDPIIMFTPQFSCQCSKAVVVLATATVVGLLTGSLGVGGGFLVVPALVLAMGLPTTLIHPTGNTHPN